MDKDSHRSDKRRFHSQYQRRGPKLSETAELSSSLQELRYSKNSIEDHSRGLVTGLIEFACHMVVNSDFCQRRTKLISALTQVVTRKRGGGMFMLIALF